MQHFRHRHACGATGPRTTQPAHVRAAALGGLVAGLLCAAGVRADPGDLDTGFANAGRLRAVLAGASVGSSVSELPDGRLLVAGSTVTPAGGEDFLIMRLTAAGTPDASFGSAGSIAVDFRGFADVAYAHLRQPDGKLLLVGRSASAAGAQAPYDYALLRLNADGTRDTAFGNGGRVIVDLGGVNEQLTDVELLPDGRIVAVGFGGTANATDAVFMRFTASGAADASFGGNGRVVVAGGSRSNAAVALEVQPDGRVLGCGYLDAVDNPLNADYWLVRLAADGSLDAAFGSGGTVTREFDGARFENANACALLPDGRILVVGSGGDPGSADQAVVRFLADGRVDTSFGTAGLLRASASVRSDQLSGIELLPDGSAFVSGVIDTDSNGVSNDPFVRRLGADGRFDASFGLGGLALVDFGYQDEPSQADAMSFTRQADGKLLFVGTSLGSPDALAVARLWPAAGGSSPGVLGLVATRVTVAEALGEIVLTVRRTGGDSGAVGVAYATGAGTATAPGDFTAVTGTLSWADGDSASKTIRIPVTNDQANEATETLTLTLDNPGGGATLAALTARLTITDDDPVVVAPPPPATTGGAGGGSGGGGASGLGTLALLAALASRRRRVPA